MRGITFITSLALTLPWLSPVLAPAQTVTEQEAHIVAQNWMAFICQRDGAWFEENNPEIVKLEPLRIDGQLAGYVAHVQPQGYVVVSAHTDFPPIKMYSTSSSLDITSSHGFAAVAKRTLGQRVRFLVAEFGGLDDAQLSGLRHHTPDENRELWTLLKGRGQDWVTTLGSVQTDGRGIVGPLLETSWHQRVPYNDLCPSMGCTTGCGGFNDRAVVGCCPLAMAQVMRYFAWPPYIYDDWDAPYDWTVMHKRYECDGNGWFNDESGESVTSFSIYETARICADAGWTLEDSWPCNGIVYGCGSTSASGCHWACNDARDGLEDYLKYDQSGKEPDCEDRTEHSAAGWFDVIADELDVNRPMIYRISDGDDYGHYVVVDGYDDTGGQDFVHANYGHDQGNTTWYAIDNFDCGGGDCNYEEEYLIRRIIPRYGFCGSISGTLPARDDPSHVHRYVYCDCASTNLTVLGGAWLQFLPGTSLKCAANSIDVPGRNAVEGATKFFTLTGEEGAMVVEEYGHVRLLPGGGLRLH